MPDEIYQGKYAWVLTPDAVLEQSLKNIGSRFPDQTMIASERPCFYLAGGEMKIAKSEVIKLRMALMELENVNLMCNLTKVETHIGFLVCSGEKLPDTIHQLILSIEVFMQPFMTGSHIEPLSSLIAIARLQKNKVVETFAQSESFNAQHLQFVELDDNLFMKRALIRVF